MFYFHFFLSSVHKVECLYQFRSNSTKVKLFPRENSRNMISWQVDVCKKDDQETRLSPSIILIMVSNWCKYTRYNTKFLLEICRIWNLLFLLTWCLTPLSTIFQLHRGGQFLLVKEIGLPTDYHRHAASNWQTLSHNVVHIALIDMQTHNISGDRHWLHR
jgi:hypothetical protein